MKIPITLQIAVLAVAMTGFYTLVGQAVPQKEVHPPEVIEVPDDVSTSELVEIGKGIFNGKGICITCHNGGDRFPTLDAIADRAASRIPGYTQLDYLAESLYEPDIFIVPGFVAGMPAIDKPPIGLTDVEILAVVAYLQTLGGEATVTLETKFVYTGGTLESDAAGEATEGAPPAGDVAPADAVTPLTNAATDVTTGSPGGI